MEVGFHSIHFSPLLGGTAPLLGVIEATAAAGFDALGLDRGAIDDHVARGGKVADVAGALDRHGLACTDLIFLQLRPDPAAVAADAAALAEMATVIGARVCLAAAVAPFPDDARRAEVASAAAAVLSAAGVRLAIEFVPYSHLRTLQETVVLCDAVGWDRAGLAVDSLHVFRGGTPLAELAALDGEQIALVQFSDAPAQAPADLADESRNDRRVPGEGGLDLDGFVAAVRATGFDGPVTPEILAEGVRREDPLAFASRTRAAMARYWAGG